MSEGGMKIRGLTMEQAGQMEQIVPGWEAMPRSEIIERIAIWRDEMLDLINRLEANAQRERRAGMEE
jgi:hypothetical protein